MPYIQSDRSNTPNGRSLHLITLLHRKEPVPLTPGTLLISGYGQVILFFFCGQHRYTQTFIVQPSRWEKEISRWLRFNNQAFDTHKRRPLSQVTHEDVGVRISLGLGHCLNGDVHAKS